MPSRPSTPRRYISAITMAETAKALGLAERTLDRQWR
jgi:hypothetical protein